MFDLVVFCCTLVLLVRESSGFGVVWMGGVDCMIGYGILWEVLRTEGTDIYAKLLCLKIIMQG